jgi:IS5 family transposase
MRQKLSTEQGRNQYAERKWLSEAPNGWIKQALGFRRFSVRGLNQAQGEWALVCLALNMKRMQGLAAA